MNKTMNKQIDRQPLNDGHLTAIIDELWTLSSQYIKSTRGYKGSSEWLEDMKQGKAFFLKIPFTRNNVELISNGIIEVFDIQKGKEKTAHIFWVTSEPEANNAAYEELIKYCFDDLKVDNIQYDWTYTLSIRKNISKLEYEFADEQKKRLEEAFNALTNGEKPQEIKENGNKSSTDEFSKPDTGKQHRNKSKAKKQEPE